MSKFQSDIVCEEQKLRSKYSFESIVGHHPKIIEVLKLISQVADTDATILILGESGTGKELVARALFENSKEKDREFIPINCGGLPENLLESELFGHEKGAFTGAQKNKMGWFERADGGTIFFDEVSEMTGPLQVKLLRILQTGEFSRIGSTDIRYCKVRIIAATNKDLQMLVQDGTFREDLFYRLNVIDIILPPLRERRSDIPILIQHYLNLFGEKYYRKIDISKRAEQLLTEYDYPGNIRQLENVIHRAIILCEGNFIKLENLPINISNGNHINGYSIGQSSFRLAKSKVVEEFERKYIIECLTTSNGNVSFAARCAGINVKNFHVKMNKYSIDPHLYK